MDKPTLTVFEGDELGWGISDLVPSKKKARRYLKRKVRQTKNLSRQTKNLAKKAVSFLGIPKWLQRKIKSGIKKVFGDELTIATKAAILPGATSLALSIPGVQPYAPMVPVALNQILNELIKEGEKRVKKSFSSKGSSTKKSSSKKKAGNMPTRKKRVPIKWQIRSAKGRKKFVKKLVTAARKAKFERDNPQVKMATVKTASGKKKIINPFARKKMDERFNTPEKRNAFRRKLANAAKAKKAAMNEVQTPEQIQKRKTALKVGGGIGAGTLLILGLTKALS